MKGSSRLLARFKAILVVIVTDESKPQTKGLSPDDPAYHIWRKAVKTGIKDLADEHDHYAYGCPKRGKPEKPSDV